MAPMRPSAPLPLVSAGRFADVGYWPLVVGCLPGRWALLVVLHKRGERTPLLEPATEPTADAMSASNSESAGTTVGGGSIRARCRHQAEAQKRSSTHADWLSVNATIFWSVG